MIRIGRIVNIIGEAGNEVYSAKYVNVLFNDNPNVVKGYAKQVSDLDILVEIIAALLGRKLGLPIPEPALGFYRDNEVAWFVSIDVNVPDLSHRLDIDLNKQMKATSRNW